MLLWNGGSMSSGNGFLLAAWVLMLFASRWELNKNKELLFLFYFSNVVYSIYIYIYAAYAWIIFYFNKDMCIPFFLYICLGKIISYCVVTKIELFMNFQRFKKANILLGRTPRLVIVCYCFYTIIIIISLIVFWTSFPTSTPKTESKKTSLRNELLVYPNNLHNSTIQYV